MNATFLTFRLFIVKKCEEILNLELDEGVNEVHSYLAKTFLLHIEKAQTNLIIQKMVIPIDASKYKCIS